jgi:hypothetical protein
MIAAAPLKAVLLWCVYAHHLTAAKERHPERVTLVEIDRFLASSTAGPALLERLGRSVRAAVPIGDALEPGVWGRGAGLRWRLAHAASAALCRALGARLGPQRAQLADQSRWLRELRQRTDF